MSKYIELLSIIKDFIISGDEIDHTTLEWLNNTYGEENVARAISEAKNEKNKMDKQDGEYNTTEYEKKRAEQEKELRKEISKYLMQRAHSDNIKRFYFGDHERMLNRIRVKYPNFNMEELEEIFMQELEMIESILAFDKMDKKEWKKRYE